MLVWFDRLIVSGCGCALECSSAGRRIQAGRLSAVSLALGTTAPVGDLGLVDFVAHIVGCGEARGGADRAVDVDQAAANATNQVMVVVVDSIFVAGRRTDRLNAPDEPVVDEHAEGVVDGLARDGSDVDAGDLGHAVGGDVGTSRHRAQDGQALSCHVDTALTKEVSRTEGHDSRLYQYLY